MGVGCEKQAEKPTPEANRYVPERKLGVGAEKKAWKPMTWVWMQKSELENPQQANGIKRNSFQTKIASKKSQINHKKITNKKSHISSIPILKQKEIDGII